MFQMYVPEKLPTLQGGEKNFPIDLQDFDEILEEVNGKDLVKAELRDLARLQMTAKDLKDRIYLAKPVGGKLSEELNIEAGLPGEFKRKDCHDQSLFFLFGTDIVGINCEGRYRSLLFENPLNYSVTKNSYREETLLTHAFHFPEEDFNYWERITSSYGEMEEMHPSSEKDRKAVYVEEWK